LGEIAVIVRYIWEAAVYTVVSTALYFLLLYGGWGLLAWFGAVAPPSPKGGWWNGALVALGILAGARDFSSHLEAQEKSTGVSGFWGPYRREAAIGAFTGAAGLWLLVRYRAFDLTDSPVVNFVVWSAFAVAGAFAWAMSYAGRRRDRPLLAAIADAMDGFIAGVGVMSAVLAFAVWHASTDGQIDQRAGYVLVVICGALGAGVNLWRRSERGVSIRLRPNDPFPHNGRGNAWSDKGDLDRAITDYTEAIHLDPNDANAYASRGKAYQSKKEYDRAIADYDQAIRLDRNNANAYGNRGNARSDRGDLDRAIADYDVALQIRPGAVDYRNRGRAYESKKECDRAIADYTQAIQLEPKYVLAFNNRGAAYRAKGEREHATADFQKVLTLDPDDINRQFAETALRQLGAIP
jgi:Tfp pilus assembly protein PilF